MNQYESLAFCYDRFTRDIDYPQWADYLQSHFPKAQKPVHSVLDLACGTGSMSWLLAERGFEVIGVDFSPEMLAQAQAKDFPVAEAPIFLCQAMEDLDLYGTIDACVCLLDSVNHITDPQTLQTAFAKVELFLEPEGVFIFDMLTPSRLARMDGGLFLDETEDAYCVWRTEFDPDTRICSYLMDLFLQEEDGLWVREQECHEEYAYTPQELSDMLRAVGFCNIQCFGALSHTAPQKGEERLFFTATKKGL